MYLRQSRRDRQSVGNKWPGGAAIGNGRPAVTWAVTSTIALTLVDGARVVVPDSLNLITPYVLREQQDWFEDEIKFVRRLLRPGDKVVDIGASYGVYTLTMAQAVGPSGSVWAFEPASETARLLAEGIVANSFTQVVLERSALSSAPGTARLSLNENSELNALIAGGESSAPSETVPVVTLDECMERHGWRDIEFMKIDAEGEEANILRGGARFFSELSPLVLYEIRAGSDVHLELVRDFAALGYASYRLVPGLNVLVAFDPGITPDEYLLNLFCCRPDRAERLAARGLLVSVSHLAGASRAVATQYDWRQTIAKLPYATQLAERWERTVAAGDSAEVEAALSHYTASRDPSLPSNARFAALETSFNLLAKLCERDPSRLRLGTLARVARDYGARSLAVNALRQLASGLQIDRVDPSEPFLPPGERFDSIPTGPVAGRWLLAAVLEEFERLLAFSSFYTGPSARSRLETIRALGFGSPEMESRLRLVQERFGPPPITARA